MSGMRGKGAVLEEVGGHSLPPNGWELELLGILPRTLGELCWTERMLSRSHKEKKNVKGRFCYTDG